MTPKSQAPAAHAAFVARFPLLGRAWDLVGQEGRSGPLDEKTQRLVKLAIAVGAMREGAVHAGIRKARDAGVSPIEMEQVVALAASTIGFPATVAVWTWLHESGQKEKGVARRAPRRRVR